MVPKSRAFFSRVVPDLPGEGFGKLNLPEKNLFSGEKSRPSCGKRAQNSVLRETVLHEKFTQHPSLLTTRPHPSPSKYPLDTLECPPKHTPKHPSKHPPKHCPKYEERFAVPPVLGARPPLFPLEARGAGGLVLVRLWTAVVAPRREPPSAWMAPECRPLAAAGKREPLLVFQPVRLRAAGEREGVVGSSPIGAPPPTISEGCIVHAVVKNSSDVSDMSPVNPSWVVFVSSIFVWCKYPWWLKELSLLCSYVFFPFISARRLRFGGRTSPHESVNALACLVRVSVCSCLPLHTGP